MKLLRLQDVLDQDLCAGCGFCESASSNGTVRMDLNSAGFLRPCNTSELNTAEIELIERVCPGINGEDVATTATTTAPRYDHMWGGYLTCRTGYATDSDIRFVGSSGGAITAIAKWLLETKQVDHVVTSGTSRIDMLRTEPRIHTNSQVIAESAGSKYAPSSPLSILKQISENPGRYAYIGKPCDITALRRAIALQYLRNCDILLISFFCAGVPSDKQNVDLLKRLGVPDRNQLASFRHRGHGWPGKTQAITKKGELFECSYNESWGGVLRKGLQFRCKICPDGIGEAADIVCADAWYGDEKGYPKFDETEGRSLIISRTSIGETILSAAIADKAIEVAELPIRSIDSMQPGQLKRRRELRSRIRALKLIGRKTPSYNTTALAQYQKDLPTTRKLLAAINTWKSETKRLLRRFLAD